MANINFNVTLLIKWKIRRRHDRVFSENIYLENKTQNWVKREIRVPQTQPDWIPTGEAGWFTVFDSKWDYFIKYLGLEKNCNYLFEVGVKKDQVRAWPAYVSAQLFGNFYTFHTSEHQTSPTLGFSIPKEQKSAVYLGEVCSKFITDADAFDINCSVQSDSSSDIQCHLNNSSTDPNATGGGCYLWARYSDVKIPEILDVRPSDNTVISNTLMPEIIANFTDNEGSGINLKSFTLTIDPNTQNQVITANSQGIKSAGVNGFVYQSNKLSPCTHNIWIDISDNHGNKAKRWQSAFTINVNTTPIISNLKPTNNPPIHNTHQPECSAIFIESNGGGIKTETFQLNLQGPENISVNSRTTPSEGLLQLNEQGFRYVPPRALKNGYYTLTVSVSDQWGIFFQAIKTNFFLDANTVPEIINLAPALNTLVSSDIQPSISANFKDAGGGVNEKSFTLTLSGNGISYNITATTSQADGLQSLTKQGFLYKPPVSLPNGIYMLRITIADTFGFYRDMQSSFMMSFKPFNATIGELSVDALEHVGAVTAGKYKNIGISTISDIVRQNPADLAKQAGVTISIAIDNVKRARIVCNEARFQRKKFGELYDWSISKIINTSDEDILKHDATAEPQTDLLELRENVALLVVCLNDINLNTLTFGDIVVDQPE